MTGDTRERGLGDPEEERPEPPSAPAGGRPWATPASLVRFLGSSTLALVLVGVLASLVLAGSVLPQEGVLGADTVEAWCADHPVTGPAARWLGLFRVFRTAGFMAVVGLLGVNTLACTLLRFVREGGWAGIRAGGTLRRTGFYTLHAGLVLLIAAGFWSFAAELDGHVFLTEGQVFREAHDDDFPDLQGAAAGRCGTCGSGRGAHTGYRTLYEGPLRPERHLGFEVRLDRVEVELAGGVHRVDVASRLTVLEDGRAGTEGTSRFNLPLRHRGFSFVSLDTGYAPLLSFRRRASGMPLGSFYLTLTTDEGPGLRRFHDVIPLDFLGHRTIATLLPTSERVDGALVCTSEDLANPAMVFEALDGNGATVQRAEALQGEWAALDDLEFRFDGVRRWSSFRVTSDDGYGLARASLLLCLLGMVLRYLQDLAGWKRDGEASSEKGEEAA